MNENIDEMKKISNEFNKYRTVKPTDLIKIRKMKQFCKKKKMQNKFKLILSKMEKEIILYYEEDFVVYKNKEGKYEYYVIEDGEEIFQAYLELIEEISIEQIEEFNISENDLLCGLINGRQIEDFDVSGEVFNGQNYLYFKDVRK